VEKRGSAARGLPKLCFVSGKGLGRVNVAGWRALQASSQRRLLLNTGDLESFKKQSFVLKEGVEYRIKISFRVRWGL
jgi:hypothetical protein